MISVLMYFSIKKQAYPIYFLTEILKNCKELLLTGNEAISHYVYIKDLNHLCIIKQNIDINNMFAFA